VSSERLTPEQRATATRDAWREDERGRVLEAFIGDALRAHAAQECAAKDAEIARLTRERDHWRRMTDIALQPDSTPAPESEIARLKALLRSAQNSGAEANNEIERLRAVELRLNAENLRLSVRTPPTPESEIERLRREASEACVAHSRHHLSQHLAGGCRGDVKWADPKDVISDDAWIAQRSAVYALRALDAALAAQAAKGDEDRAVEAAMKLITATPDSSVYGCTLFSDAARRVLPRLYQLGLLRAKGGAA